MEPSTALIVTSQGDVRIIFVRSRKGSISHSNITDKMTSHLVKIIINNNFILIYPSQAEFGIQINDDIIGTSMLNGYKNFLNFRDYVNKKLKF